MSTQENARQEVVQELARRFRAAFPSTQRSTPPSHHFVPHYPSPRNPMFRLVCWCTQEWKSPELSRATLPEMIDFVNEHAACQAAGR